jgi:polar amino acid transport system substrate-binding protein
MKIFASALFVVGAMVSLAWPAAASSLDVIRGRGMIAECVHPNALPFASRKGELPGFQIELGQAIAKELGVALEPVWIIGPSHIRRTGCDMVLDAIADPEAQGETGLQISKPYYRTGVVLAVREDSPLTSPGAIDPHAKIGVMGSSVAAVTFSQRGLTISSYGFEDELLDAVVAKEIGAAAVSRAAAGYFNITHPAQPIRAIDIGSMAPGLSWNVAVGLVKPDDKLRQAIDAALDRLTADGTIQRIYARYGITLQPPK